MGLRQLVIVVFASFAYTVLQVVGTAFSSGTDRVPIVPFTAIFIPVAMWFGIWGARGGLFGAVLYDLPAGDVLVAFGTAPDDFLGPAIVGSVARAFKVDPSLRTLRDYLMYTLGVAIGMAVQSILGGLFFFALGLRTFQELPQQMASFRARLMIAGVVFAPILPRLSPRSFGGSACITRTSCRPARSTRTGSSRQRAGEHQARNAAVRQFQSARFGSLGHFPDARFWSVRASSLRNLR